MSYQLNIDTLSTRLKGMIVQKAEGNPFFLEEILRSMIDTGVLVYDGDTRRWQTAIQVDSITIPDTIQGVIIARVDQLNEDCKEVLRMAAVIGRSFFYRVLRAVQEKDGELEQHLANLQEVEFILKKEGSAELQYIFKHALAQEATYNSILIRHRREIHGRVGHAIEILFHERLEEFYGLLAYHYAVSESWEKAQYYLLEAGDQAGRMAADAEALVHYRQALEAYERAFGDKWEPLQRASLERKMGEAFLRRGEHDLAEEYFHRSLTILGNPLPKSRWGVRLGILREIAVLIACRLFQRFLLPPVKEMVDQVVEEEDQTYYDVLWIYGVSSVERFFLTVIRRMNFCLRSGYAYGIASSYTGFGFIGDFIPVFSFAERYHHRSVEMSKKIEHPRALGLAYFGLAYCNQLQCKWTAAVESGRLSAEAYNKAGELRGWGTSMLYGVIFPYALRGDLERSLSLSEELIRIGEDGNDPSVSACGLTGQGLSLLRMGQLANAAASLERASALALSIPDHWLICESSGILGKCYLRQGEVTTALTRLEDTLLFIEQHSVRGCSLHLVRNSLAEAYLTAAEQDDNGDKKYWLKKTRQACRAALKQGKATPAGMPEAMMLQGRYYWMRGKPAAAQKCWKRSLNLAEENGMTYELGITFLEMGSRLKKKEDLKQAGAIFSDMGAEGEFSRVKAKGAGLHS